MIPDHIAEAGQEMVDALREARLAKGITQAEVAQGMGTTQSTVSQIEANQHSPLLSTILRYAEVLEVDFYWEMSYDVDIEEEP